MQRKEHLLDVIRVLFKWKTFIIVVCVVALIGSVVLSLMLDNYYQSTTLFYATNSDLAKPNPIGNNDNERIYYGIGDDIDRIMTIAESERLANFLIDTFNLYQHYNIDTSSYKQHFKVMEVFNSQFKVIKTKYDAIQILVEDTDPRLAVSIANTAREKVNELAQEILRSSQEQQIRMMSHNIAQRTKAISMLEDSLYEVRKKYGIYNPDTQSRDLPEMLLIKSGELQEERGRLTELKKYDSVPQDTIIYSTARIRGLEMEVSDLRSQLNNLAEGLSDTEVLYRHHQIQKDQLGFEGQRLKQLEAAYSSGFAAIHVIEHANYPRDKSRPKRSIIVIVSLILAFILSCIAAVVTESYREINWQEVLNG